MRKEPVMEICIGSIGLFCGAIIPALQAAASSTDMSVWSLIIYSLAMASGAVAAVTGFLWHQRAKTHKSLAETIRSRPRIPVNP